MTSEPVHSWKGKSYVHRPTEVKAWRAGDIISIFKNGDGAKVSQEIKSGIDSELLVIRFDHIKVSSRGDYVTARGSDMLVLNGSGEFYPCPYEIFASGYEEKIDGI